MAPSPMTIRNFVRIFQQGWCQARPSAPAEGSTCLAKGPVVAAFLRQAPSGSPHCTPFPFHLPGDSSKAVERARPSFCIALLARETLTGSRSGNRLQRAPWCCRSSKQLAALCESRLQMEPLPAVGSLHKPPSPLSWCARLQSGSNDLGVPPPLCCSGGVQEGQPGRRV